MKEDTVYLQHILECIARIRAYTAAGRKAFSSDTMIQDAVIRNLEVMGEATKQVSESTRDLYPDIPWRRMAGLRDVLIHNYLGVDVDEVWNVVDKHLGIVDR